MYMVWYSKRNLFTPWNHSTSGNKNNVKAGQWEQAIWSHDARQDYTSAVYQLLLNLNLNLKGKIGVMRNACLRTTHEDEDSMWYFFFICYDSTVTLFTNLFLIIPNGYLRKPYGVKHSYVIFFSVLPWWFIHFLLLFSRSLGKLLFRDNKCFPYKSEINTLRSWENKTLSFTCKL